MSKAKRPTVRLNRESSGGRTNYFTRDNLFRVWQEPYRPRRWYVNQTLGAGEWDDAHPADGFETLADAREYLAKRYDEIRKQPMRPVCEVCGSYGDDPHKADCPLAEPEPKPEVSFATIGSPKGEQMSLMMDEMESYTKHKIQCWVCMKTETARDTTEARFARELYADGWRVIESEKYQTKGTACPECVKIPDDKL